MANEGAFSSKVMWRETCDSHARKVAFADLRRLPVETVPLWQGPVQAGDELNPRSLGFPDRDGHTADFRITLVAWHRSA